MQPYVLCEVSIATASISFANLLESAKSHFRRGMHAMQRQRGLHSSSSVSGKHRSQSKQIEKVCAFRLSSTVPALAMPFSISSLYSLW